MDAQGAIGPIECIAGSSQNNSAEPAAYGLVDDHRSSVRCENDTKQDEEDEDGESEGEDEDEEPHFKYIYLTKHLGPLYRNGDVTSTSFAAGDKMIIGTHSGNTHVLSLPLLQPLRVYHAHSASITAISVSPFPTASSSYGGHINRNSEGQDYPSRPSTSSASIHGQRKPNQYAPLPATPSNSIYIATSSIDGNVCVSSLVDPKDVILRNFGRPVQAVALSPEYKSDRAFLSGGRAGDLILTTGAKAGVSTNSTTMGGAAAATSSWLGSIGLGTDSGKDVILHSGEGPISTIKWSLSGKYVAWVNEEGIKIMRSNMHLDSSDSEFAWRRISHIDRPTLPGWEEMASVWKARAEWVDESFLDAQDEPYVKSDMPSADSLIPQAKTIEETVEKLVIGWGSTVWVINVYPNRASRICRGKNMGSAEVVTILRTDCIISGVSLYTRNLIVVLAHIEAEMQSGANCRQKSLEPEVRIIDIDSKEEISADTISVSRYEGLTSSDYHMCFFRPLRQLTSANQRGTLGTLGSSIWDATTYPVRLFSSGASIHSTTSSGDKGSIKTQSFPSRRQAYEDPLPKEIQDVIGTFGIRIFVHGPYDCVAAVKRGLPDRLTWLVAREKFAEAWALIDEHPESVGPMSDAIESATDIAAKSQSSLCDFFADDRSSIVTAGQGAISVADNEKRRIGELWIGQLISENMWTKAAEACTKVLHTAPRWEHWIWIFVKNDKIDEISPFIPVDLHPSLPSLVYEVILGHYISRDRIKLKGLLDTWPLDLLETSSVIEAGKETLKSMAALKDSEEWRILLDCLARLYLVGGQYREALHCYIQLQDADTAMSIIREHRLLDAVSDDIPAFITIRVSKTQLMAAPVSELEEITAEPIRLLVREAYTGIVSPRLVVHQLQDANKLIFLYFYLRALWRGEALPADATKPRRGRGAREHASDAASKLAADEGKAVVDHFADTAVELFADYDRPLLMEFLQISTAYSFDIATTVCEARHFTTELIYLLSKMGQTKRALSLILSDLKDVSQAISFTKSQNDPDLWEDLLDYSMDKPQLIHGLLIEAGTSIDPIKLVRRIPSGLEIEGLREGLIRMIREHDLQVSISQGAARILQSEVAVGMDTLRRGQRRGIKFNIRPETVAAAAAAAVEKKVETEAEKEKEPNSNVNESDRDESAIDIESGRCAGCHAPFHTSEKEILVSFTCGHVFHLSHALSESEEESPLPSVSGTRSQSPRPYSPSFDEISSPASASRTVGPKVTTARLLKERLGGGCRFCATRKKRINGVAGMG